MERVLDNEEEAVEATGGDSSAQFASLTAGLMARKGEAMPAPAHLDGVSIHSHGVVAQPMTAADQQLALPAQQPLFPAGLPSAMHTSAAPPLTLPQASEFDSGDAELRRRARRHATEANGDCCDLPLPRAVVETLPEGPYSKVTSRLDPERVRKLKILAARMSTTNQKVMLAALDYYLDFATEVLAKECPCIARSIAGED